MDDAGLCLANRPKVHTDKDETGDWKAASCRLTLDQLGMKLASVWDGDLMFDGVCAQANGDPED